MKTISRIIIIPFLLLTIAAALVDASENLITYQGLLRNNSGGISPDSTYQIEFRLFDDKTAGNLVWSETAEIMTTDGLFMHLIGSATQLPAELFTIHDNLYLELMIQSEALLPRTLIGTVGYSLTSKNLSSKDSSGQPSIRTENDQHKLIIFDSAGAEHIQFQNLPFDSSVILPDSAINNEEILDEPGLTYSININPVTLATGEMMDLTDLTITIPADGYILLYGKCYLVLSGTTGANSAIVQIDENEGGGTQFPYYSIAGLSGYVNSGANYFPVMITRLYYKQQGTYTFRLEGRANNALPATAQSWDHILTAFYYSTAYAGVEAIVTDPSGFQNALPIERTDDDINSASGSFYKVDLRELEVLTGENRK